MSLPNLPPLTQFIAAGSEGGGEFSRLLNLLLAHSYGTRLTMFSDQSGDYKGVDSILEGTIGIQYKFYPSPLSSKHKSEIKRSLKNATDNFSEMTEWLLITPQDLKKADITWFDTLASGIPEEKRKNIKLVHRGHTFLIELFEQFPALGAKYYPSAFSNKVVEATLMPELSKLIENAFSNIKLFRPFTALDTLKQIQEIAVKQISDKNFFGRLSYILGFAYYETGFVKEGAAAMIEAYNLCPTELEYKIRAAKSFFNLKDYTNAQKLAVEILASNPEEPSSQAILFCLDDKKHSQSDIEKIPDAVLLSEQAISLIHGFFVTKGDSLVSQRILVRFLSYLDSEVVIDFNNKLKWLLLGQMLFAKFDNENQFLTFDYVDPKCAANPTLLRAQRLLKTAVNALGSTEIKMNIALQMFTLHFVNFLVTANNEEIKAMADVARSSKSDKKKSNFYTNVLFRAYVMAAQSQAAINIYPQLDAQSREAFEPILIYSYAKVNQIEKAKELAKAYFDRSTLKVGMNNIHVLSFYINGLLTSSHDRIELVEFLRARNSFESELYQVFAYSYVLFSNDAAPDQINELLLSVDKALQEAGDREKVIAAGFYFNIKNYSKTIELLTGIIDEDIPSEELLCYIVALYELGTESEKTLQLMKKWRTQYPFDVRLAKKELAAHIFLEDWATAEECANHILNSSPADYREGRAQLMRIYCEQNKLSEAEIIFDELIVGEKTWHQVQFLFPFAIGFKRYETALQLLYPLALIETNYVARETFFSAALTLDASATQFLEPPKQGIQGAAVYYTIDGRQENMLIDSGNPLGLQFVGKNEGDTFLLKVAMTGEFRTVTILGYAHKFVWLARKIRHEMTRNPASKIAIIEIPDNTLASFEKKMVELFGTREDERRKYRAEILNQYYLGQSDFTTVTRTCFEDKPFDATYGLFELPDLHFRALPDALCTAPYTRESDSQFVVDFPCVIMLFELARAGIEVRRNFVVSTKLISILENEIERLHVEPPAKMVLHISQGGASPHFYDDGFVARRMATLKNILGWIKENCRTIIVPRKLELRSFFEQKKERLSEYQHYIFDTLVLATLENNILLTEDSFVRNLIGPPGLTNMNQFLSRMLSAEDVKKARSILARKKIVGITVDEDILYDIYFDSKHRGVFWVALINIRPDITCDVRYSLETVLKFLKRVYVEALISDGEKARITTEVFKYFLHSLLAYQPTLPGVRLLVEIGVEKHFKLLPQFPPFILKGYDDAEHILMN